MNFLKRFIFLPARPLAGLLVCYLPALWLGYLLLVTSPVFALDPDLGHDPATFSDLETYISDFLGGVTGLGLIAVFVMFLYGGFVYLTADGNPEKTKSASGILTYAVIGLVLMIGAWFIIRFLEELTGVELTNFSIVIP